MKTNAIKNANTPIKLNAKEVIKWLNSNVIHPQLNKSIVDIFNFHNYSSSAWAKLTLDYINNNYAIWKEIISNEMGISPADKNLIEDKWPITEKLVTTTSSLGTKIAPSEIVKKYVLFINNWVSLITLFTFPQNDKFSIPYLWQFWNDPVRWKWLRKPVKENIQMVINLQNRIWWKILSKSFIKDNTNNLQTYTFSFSNKTVKIMWVSNILNQNDIKIIKDNNNCSLFDIYWNKKTDTSISKEPVFEECNW